MDSKSNILYVTQTLGHKAACGIGIMGDTVGKLINKSNKYYVHILYTDSPEQVDATIASIHPILVLYNFGAGTTPWVDTARWMRDKWPSIPHVKLYHDYGSQEIVNTYSPEQYGGFQYMIMDDPTLTGTAQIYIVPRAIPTYTGPEYPYSEIPTIGFQGFGAVHKGIPRIAAKVQEEFDHAILRLHIPFGFYGDPHGNDARARVNECRSIITKPGITIEASHELLSTDGILDFLAKNTVNCYFNDYLDRCGLASSPDYALAVRRPIALTRSHQFRNYWELTPSVCIEERSLRDIIQSGVEPLKPLYEQYAEENVLRSYENHFETIVQRHR